MIFNRYLIFEDFLKVLKAVLQLLRKMSDGRISDISRLATLARNDEDFVTSSVAKRNREVSECKCQIH